MSDQEQPPPENTKSAEAAPAVKTGSAEPAASREDLLSKLNQPYTDDEKIGTRLIPNIEAIANRRLEESDKSDNKDGGE